MMRATRLKREVRIMPGLFSPKYPTQRKDTVRDSINAALIENAVKALKRAGERAGLSRMELCRVVEQELFEPIFATVNEAQTSTPQPVRMSDEERAETINMLAWESSDKDTDDPNSVRLFSLLVAVAVQYVHALMDEGNNSDANPESYVNSAVQGLFENLEVALVDPYKEELVTVYAVAHNDTVRSRSFRLYTWMADKDEALRCLANVAVAYPTSVYSYHEVQVPRSKMVFIEVQEALFKQMQVLS